MSHLTRRGVQSSAETWAVASNSPFHEAPHTRPLPEKKMRFKLFQGPDNFQQVPTFRQVPSQFPAALRREDQGAGRLVAGTDNLRIELVVLQAKQRARLTLIFETAGDLLGYRFGRFGNWASEIILHGGQKQLPPALQMLAGGG